MISKEGKIDILVNNAGFGIVPAAAIESSVSQAQAIFNTNFFGIVRMICATLPHMQKQGYGRIINISSIAGILPIPFNALYCSTKHAMEASLF